MSDIEDGLMITFFLKGGMKKGYREVFVFFIRCVNIFNGRSYNLCIGEFFKSEFFSCYYEFLFIGEVRME